MRPLWGHYIIYGLSYVVITLVRARRSPSKTQSCPTVVKSGLYIFMVLLPSRAALLPFSVFILAFQAFGAKSPVPPTLGGASAILRGLPIVFEPNGGRWDPGVKFSARTGDYRLFARHA